MKGLLATAGALAAAVLMVALARPAWTQQAAAMPQGNAAAGEQAFRRLCTACHIATAEGPRRLGPTLFGVVGRHSGSVPGFTYSRGNREADLVWTPEVLFEYLRNPRAMVRNTTMAFAGIRDDQERANVIAYLQTLQPAQ
jgi:cytochrome c